jgi:hypothetical protein
LDARQWREMCGLRAKNEPLATKARLRRTARSVQQEEAIGHRAPDATDDQARDRQQRRPARNNKRCFANTKPRREKREALQRKKRSAA